MSRPIEASTPRGSGSLPEATTRPPSGAAGAARHYLRDAGLPTTGAVAPVRIGVSVEGPPSPGAGPTERLLEESVRLTVECDPIFIARMTALGAARRGTRSFTLAPTAQAIEGLADLVSAELLCARRSFERGHVKAAVRTSHLRREITESPSVGVNPRLRELISDRVRCERPTGLGRICQVLVSHIESSDLLSVKVVTFPLEEDPDLGPRSPHNAFRPRGVIQPEPLRADQAIEFLWALGRRFPEVGVGDRGEILGPLERAVRSSSVLCEVRGMPGYADLIDGRPTGRPVERQRLGVAAAMRVAGRRREGGGRTAVSVAVADAARMEAAKPSLDEALLEPQRRVVGAHLATGTGLVNASQVGTGKTAQTARAWRAKAASLEGFRALLVCGAELREQWQEELSEKFFAEAQVLIARPDAGRIATQIARFERDAGAEAGIVIASYETARAHTDGLGVITWDELVVDEAARLANPRTQLSRALWKLRPKAAVAIALTGTPLGKSLGELDSIMAFCRDDSRALRERPLERAFSGFDTLSRARLHEALGPCLQRVRRAELAEHMPEVAEVETTRITPGPAQRELLELISHRIADTYGEVSERLRRKAEAGGELAAAAESELRSMRGILLSAVTVARLASDPESIRSSKAQLAGLLESGGVLQRAIEEGSPVRRVVAETIAAAVADEEQVLVFSDFSSHLRLVADELRDKHGIEPAMFTGDTPPAQRPAIKRRFREGSERVVLISAVGEEGHNIQPASAEAVVIHLEVPWEPRRFIQRTGRAGRIGSSAERIAVLVPLLRDSIQMRVAEVMLPRAAKAIEALNRDGEVDESATQLGSLAAEVGSEAGEEGSVLMRICGEIFREHAS